MAITKEFRDAVAAQNIKRVRIMMKDSLLIDPAGGSFDEMARAAEGLAGLYDEHDGREMAEDESAWNDDYMDRLMVQAVGNFSPERLAHLKKVLRRLRPGLGRPIERTTERPTEGEMEGQNERLRYEGGHGSSDQRRHTPRNCNKDDDWQRFAEAGGKILHKVWKELTGDRRGRRLN